MKNKKEVNENLENTKKGKALLIMTVLMLSSMFTLSILGLSIVPASAIKIQTTNQLIYGDGTGANLATLAKNPEWLILHTNTFIDTDTTIIVDGIDEYGQNIEATAFVPAGTFPETLFLLEDYVSCEPVAFAQITAVLQQNGTHGNQFEILTQPAPIVGLGQNSYQFYLGEYHQSLGVLGWHPGHMTPSFPVPPEGYYLFGNGPGTSPTVTFGTPQPFNPDPLIVWLNWKDNNHDLVVDNVGSGLPQADTVQPSARPAILYIEGLDEAGNKLVAQVNIPAGATSAVVVAPNGHTFAEVDNVYGGGSDSYYIFTNPAPSLDLLQYTIVIDHIQMYPGTYDILANPEIEGKTAILVAFVDIDNDLVHTSFTALSNVTLSFYSSGGTIQPSTVKLNTGVALAVVYLTADTSPRTIKVSVDAIIPAIVTPSALSNLNIWCWFEMTEDGVSSVLWTGWPIHQLMWGYNDTAAPLGVTLPVTPKPPWQAFVEEDYPDVAGTPFHADDKEAGEEETGVITDLSIKFDGPIYEVSIPIYPGCNLISSPVRPMLDEYVSGYPIPLELGNYPDAVVWDNDVNVVNTGIPMALLFHQTTSANIEAVWWYTYQKEVGGNTFVNYWNVYIPATDQWLYGNATYSNSVYGNSNGPYFTDGVGYWVKADKAATIELSGVIMENAPFTPPTYTLAPFRWNLVGVTSVNPITTSSYLEGLFGIGAGGLPGSYSAASGAIGVKAPVWLWDARTQTWARDPLNLYPTNAFWLFTSATGLAV